MSAAMFTLPERGFRCSLPRARGSSRLMCRNRGRQTFASEAKTGDCYSSPQARASMGYERRSKELIVSEGCWRAELDRCMALALNYYMRKPGQSAKILGTSPERGHSCPQQLPNTQQDRNVRALYFRSTLLRTRMSALRFGSGSAGLRTDAPYPKSRTDCARLLFHACLSSFAAPQPSKTSSETI